jgi:hypothetical protein
MFARGEAEDPFRLSDLGGVVPMFARKLPPLITVSGRITLGSDSPIGPGTVTESLQLRDNVTLTRANHSIRAGFELFRRRFVNYTIVNSMGAFTFSGQITGNAAADFFIGRAASMNVTSPERAQGGP